MGKENTELFEKYFKAASLEVTAADPEQSETGVDSPDDGRPAPENTSGGPYGEGYTKPWPNEGDEKFVDKKENAAIKEEEKAKRDNSYPAEPFAEFIKDNIILGMYYMDLVDKKNKICDSIEQQLMSGSLTSGETLSQKQADILIDCVINGLVIESYRKIEGKKSNEKILEDLKEIVKNYATGNNPANLLKDKDFDELSTVLDKIKKIEHADKALLQDPYRIEGTGKDAKSVPNIKSHEIRQELERYVQTSGKAAQIEEFAKQIATEAFGRRAARSVRAITEGYGTSGKVIDKEQLKDAVQELLSGYHRVAMNNYNDYRNESTSKSKYDPEERSYSGLLLKKSDKIPGSDKKRNLEDIAPEDMLTEEPKYTDIGTKLSAKGKRGGYLIPNLPPIASLFIEGVKVKGRGASFSPSDVISHMVARTRDLARKEQYIEEDRRTEGDSSKIKFEKAVRRALRYIGGGNQSKDGDSDMWVKGKKFYEVGALSQSHAVPMKEYKIEVMAQALMRNFAGLKEDLLAGLEDSKDKRLLALVNKRMESKTKKDQQTKTQEEKDLEKEIKEREDQLKALSKNSIHTVRKFVKENYVKLLKVFMRSDAFRAIDSHREGVKEYTHGIEDLAENRIKKQVLDYKKAIALLPKLEKTLMEAFIHNETGGTHKLNDNPLHHIQVSAVEIKEISRDLFKKWHGGQALNWAQDVEHKIKELLFDKITDKLTTGKEEVDAEIRIPKRDVMVYANSLIKKVLGSGSTLKRLEHSYHTEAMNPDSAITENEGGPETIKDVMIELLTKALEHEHQIGEAQEIKKDIEAEFLKTELQDKKARPDKYKMKVKDALDRVVEGTFERLIPNRNRWTPEFKELIKKIKKDASSEINKFISYSEPGTGIIHYTAHTPRFIDGALLNRDYSKALDLIGEDLDTTGKSPEEAAQAIAEHRQKIRAEADQHIETVKSSRFQAREKIAEEISYNIAKLLLAPKLTELIKAFKADPARYDAIKTKLTGVKKAPGAPTPTEESLIEEELIKESLQKIKVSGVEAEIAKLPVEIQSEIDDKIHGEYAKSFTHFNTVFAPYDDLQLEIGKLSKLILRSESQVVAEVIGKYSPEKERIQGNIASLEADIKKLTAKHNVMLKELGKLKQDAENPLTSEGERTNLAKKIVILEKQLKDLRDTEIELEKQHEELGNIIGSEEQDKVKAIRDVHEKEHIKTIKQELEKLNGQQAKALKAVQKIRKHFKILDPNTKLEDQKAREDHEAHLIADEDEKVHKINRGGIQTLGNFSVSVSGNDGSFSIGKGSDDSGNAGASWSANRTDEHNIHKQVESVQKIVDSISNLDSKLLFEVLNGLLLLIQNLENSGFSGDAALKHLDGIIDKAFGEGKDSEFKDILIEKLQKQRIPRRLEEVSKNQLDAYVHDLIQNMKSKGVEVTDKDEEAQRKMAYNFMIAPRIAESYAAAFHASIKQLHGIGKAYAFESKVDAEGLKNFTNIMDIQRGRHPTMARNKAQEGSSVAQPLTAYLTEVEKGLNEHKTPQQVVELVNKISVHMAKAIINETYQDKVQSHLSEDEKRSLIQAENTITIAGKNILNLLAGDIFKKSNPAKLLKIDSRRTNERAAMKTAIAFIMLLNDMLSDNTVSNHIYGLIAETLGISDYSKAMSEMYSEQAKLKRAMKEGATPEEIERINVNIKTVQSKINEILKTLNETAAKSESKLVQDASKRVSNYLTGYLNKVTLVLGEKEGGSEESEESGKKKTKESEESEDSKEQKIVELVALSLKDCTVLQESLKDFADKLIEGFETHKSFSTIVAEMPGAPSSDTELNPRSFIVKSGSDQQRNAKLLLKLARLLKKTVLQNN